MGEGKYKGEQAKLGVGTKKLIVSRQPIFTNLKSNTMKNIANIRGFFESCKPSPCLSFTFNFSYDKV